MRAAVLLVLVAQGGAWSLRSPGAARSSRVARGSAAARPTRGPAPAARAVPAAAAQGGLRGALRQPVDVADVAKYGLATGVQYALLCGAGTAVDAVLVRAGRTLPLPVVWVVFAFFSLRSRVFSLLDNSRPNREAQKGKATPSDVKRPFWTPPGVAFPVIWLTITALRATASALVYAETGALNSPPLHALFLHLAVGDTWNTITNVERRLGVSAVGCLAVWASVRRAVAAYTAVSPTAGKVLFPSLCWITVACALTANIWLINAPLRPLWPSKRDGTSATLKVANFLQLQLNSIGGRARKINSKVDLVVHKVVTTDILEGPGAKKVYCRCWKSGTFPSCDGAHVDHNNATGDNVGPLILTQQKPLLEGITI